MMAGAILIVTQYVIFKGEMRRLLRSDLNSPRFFIDMQMLARSEILLLGSSMNALSIVSIR